MKKKKKKKKKKIRDDEYTKSADVTEEKVLNLTRSILAEENVSPIERRVNVRDANFLYATKGKYLTMMCKLSLSLVSAYYSYSSSYDASWTLVLCRKKPPCSRKLQDTTQRSRFLAPFLVKRV